MFEVWWIIDKWLFAGIADSLSKNEWADETLYEVKGCTTSTETISSEAPRKSRENFAQGVSTTKYISDHL